MWTKYTAPRLGARTAWANAWWCHDMEMSTLLALCEGNPLVTSGCPSQRVSDVESWCFLCCWSEYCWWFEMPYDPYDADVMNHLLSNMMLKTSFIVCYDSFTLIINTSLIASQWKNFMLSIGHKVCNIPLAHLKIGDYSNFYYSKTCLLDQIKKIKCKDNINGLVQNCDSNSIADTLDLLQSCIKPLI